MEYIKGCLMGLFVGDACGASLEFQRKVTEEDVITAMTFPGGGALQIGPGQVTDDSELAIHLWRALRGHNPKDRQCSP